MKQETTNIEYGRKVRQIITASGDKLKTAATKIGMSAAALNYVLTGRNRFRLEHLIRFCQIYGASLDYLYFNTPPLRQHIDVDTITTVFNIINSWEKERAVQMALRDKVVVAFTLYDSIIATSADKTACKVIDLLETLAKMKQLKQSA